MSAVPMKTGAQYSHAIRMTKQGAAFTLLFDQHEHLGQSIAYARTNNVVPPWSK